MTECQGCGVQTADGITLDERCMLRADVALQYLPIYFANLGRWKPGRAGSRPVPSSRVLWSGETKGRSRVEDALDEANNAIATWAKCLIDDRGVELPVIEGDQVAACCRMFAAHLRSIATLEWAGEWFVAIEEHERILRALTEEVAPGWYAGACGRCGVATHVVPGLTWVTCTGCGATTYARDHLDTILDEARGWVARPMRLAEAIVCLVDTEQSIPRLHDRIRKWSQRGQVEGLRLLDEEGDPVGPKRYRLGEVLDRLKAEGETTLNTDGTTSRVDVA